MKKTFRQSKKNSALRRRAGYVVGTSLLAAGLQAPAAGALKPEQVYEGGAEAYSNWIEFSAGGLVTDGNKAQAEQRTRLNGGAFGGIEDLHYQTEVAKKTTLKIDGHGIYDSHNYKFGVGVEKEDLGFIRFSFENFRIYDADNGGYSPADGAAFPHAGDALALDRGKISLEAGYNKEGKPKVNFKYTHSYRNGDKSSTLWGVPPDPLAATLRLYPGILALDEKTDAIQLDVTQRIKKTDVGLGFRFETGEMNDAHKLSSFQAQKITDRSDVFYDMVSVHGFTETWLKENLFLSTGFMAANVDNTFGGSRVYGDDFDVVYSPAYAYAPNYYGYYDLNGSAHQHEYVVNVNLMALPTKSFTITPSLRVQKEDWDTHSSETGIDLSGNSMAPDYSNHGGRDSLEVRERLEARYTGFTNWVVTATADVTEGQGSLDEFGGLYQPVLGGPDGSGPVQFRTDDSRLFQKYALGTRWYPVKTMAVDFGGYYKNNQYNYNHTLDNTPNDLSTGNAYPAFLVYQNFQTWDGNTRLTLHPFSKITLVSRYEYQLSTISTRPDAQSQLGEVDSSRLHSHILGQNVSWTPLNWLCLQAGANYVISETETPASAATQAILNSQNNYWTLNFNAGIVLDDKTDLNLGYFYYRAADGQNSVVAANGLPLGTDTQEHSATATLSRRINKNLRLNLRYAYTHYEDDTAAGNYNFAAHVIFTSLQYRF